MGTDNLLVLGTWLLAGAAIAVPFIAEGIKPKGKLNFLYEKAAPYYIKTFHGGVEPVYYIRFAVHNKGNEHAENCEAVLEDIWVYDISGTPSKQFGWPATSLSFEAARGALANISPDRKMICTIGHLSSPNYQRQPGKQKTFVDFVGQHTDELRFEIDSPNPFAYGIPNCFAPGQYAFIEH